MAFVPGYKNFSYIFDYQYRIAMITDKLKNIVNKIIYADWSIKFYLVVFIVLITTCIYWRTEFPSDWDQIRKNMLPEFIGFAFDLLLLGILLAIVSNIQNKKQNIERWKEEIDDLRGIETEDAKQKILSNLKRLLRYEVKNIDLSGCFLKGADLTGFDLSDTVLCQTNFENAKLIRVSFVNSFIKGCNFKKSLIFHSDFSSAKFIVSDDGRTNSDTEEHEVWSNIIQWNAAWMEKNGGFYTNFHIDSLVMAHAGYYLENAVKYYGTKNVIDFSGSDWHFVRVSSKYCLDSLRKCGVKGLEELTVLPHNELRYEKYGPYLEDLNFRLNIEYSINKKLDLEKVFIVVPKLSVENSNNTN
jgi:hypothetical protein